MFVSAESLVGAGLRCGARTKRPPLYKHNTSTRTVHKAPAHCSNKASAVRRGARTSCHPARWPVLDNTHGTSVSEEGDRGCAQHAQHNHERNHEGSPRTRAWYPSHAAKKTQMQRGSRVSVLETGVRAARAVVRRRGVHRTEHCGQ